MSDPHAHAPPHGHPDSLPSTNDLTASPATASHPASHPASSAPDPTISTPPSKLGSRTGTTNSKDANTGGLAAASSACASKQSNLESLKVDLRQALRQFPDFPSPGILFEDIMPIFASHTHHNNLITALELQVADVFNTTTGEESNVDIIVGLESRGFLFGPTLALRLGAGFVPVRKRGKLPGECVTEGFTKEYGQDFFQMQSDAIKPGQKVVIVDDIIATGGSAAAAGTLVKKLGGQLLGYIFMMELDFLKGRAKLDAPVHTLLSGQEEALKS